MTKSQRMRESAVMISSTMPSTKYSCSGSPLILANGNTAIDGLSGSARVRALRSDAKHPHRPRDVLHLLLAQILEGEVELVTHLLVRRAAEANAAGLGQRFEPGCDIDPVAEDVALIEDYVAEIDANAELDVLPLRHRSIALGHAALNCDGATHRIDDALKLDEHAVAGGLDDAPAMLGDLGVSEFAADPLPCGHAAFLVPPPQPRSSPLL